MQQLGAGELPPADLARALEQLVTFLGTCTKAEIQERADVGIGQQHDIATLAPVAARRVDPKATSVAMERSSSVFALRKNSSSLGLAPGQPPSM